MEITSYSDKSYSIVNLTLEQINLLSQGVDMVLEDCEQVFKRPKTTEYVEALADYSVKRKESALMLRYHLRRIK
jgi:hypothetical protein